VSNATPRSVLGCRYLCVDQGEPVARRGRKARGLSETAQLPT
jgi:hypothetical protein